MAKKATVTAIYQSGEHERIAVTASLPANFPDAVAEARSQAVKGVRDVLADIVGEEYAETLAADNLADPSDD